MKGVLCLNSSWLVVTLCLAFFCCLCLIEAKIGIFALKYQDKIPLQQNDYQYGVLLLWTVTVWGRLLTEAPKPG